MDEHEDDARRAAAPNRRVLANAFIVLFLGYQVGMPLGYYLSERVYDERFSWRMFSTVRLQQCQMRILEVRDEDGQRRERPVPVAADLQAAWVTVLKRLRLEVVEKYLRRRCERSGVLELRYLRSCADTDGTRLPSHQLRMACSDGVLRAEDGP